MNTPQLADSLRAAVLQAAIKGELTERSSENARDLLLRIQNEKQALQAKGSLKKTKAPTPVTADEVPFDIPENWVWVRLSDFCYSIPSKPYQILHKETQITGDYPVVSQSKNLIDGYSNERDKIFSDVPVIIFGDHTRVIKLIDFEFVVGADGTKLLKPIKANPQYVELALKALTINMIDRGYSRHFQFIKDLPIPLPPLSEQQAIVEKLSALLAEIDRLKAEEQSLASLQKAYPQTLRASVLAAAVRGDLNERSQEHARDLLLRIQNEKQALQAKGSLKKTKALPPVGANEVPFEIPENWVWVRLGDVTDYGIGKQTPSEKIPAGSLIVEMEDIEKETYRLLDKNRERTPKSSKNSFVAGDVLYGKLRPYLKKVVVADESGFCSTEIIPFNGFGKINPQYLMFCMTSPFMLSSVNQLTYGMDMPRLGTNDAKNLLIPLPPLAEQQAIVEKLSALLAEIDALENA